MCAVDDVSIHHRADEVVALSAHRAGHVQQEVDVGVTDLHTELEAVGGRLALVQLVKDRERLLVDRHACGAIARELRGTDHVVVCGGRHRALALLALDSIERRATGGERVASGRHVDHRRVGRPHAHATVGAGQGESAPVSECQGTTGQTAVHVQQGIGDLEAGARTGAAVFVGGVRIHERGKLFLGRRDEIGIDVFAATPVAVLAVARPLAAHHLTVGHQTVIEEAADGFLARSAGAPQLRSRTRHTIVGDRGVRVIAVASAPAVYAEAVPVAVDACDARIHLGSPSDIPWPDVGAPQEKDCTDPPAIPELHEGPRSQSNLLTPAIQQG